MNFLQTFFGQIFRKSDIDFQNDGVRRSAITTHVDITNMNGGIVNGLKISKSIDGRSILVTPGVFYSKGDIFDENSQGGGERCEIFTDQTITGFPTTSPILGQQSYLLIYAKSAGQDNNPDPTKSQTISTSKNVQTNENIPIRQYTTGIIAVTNPILISEVGNIGGVPLALLQVDQSGIIQSFDTSLREDYKVAGIVDLPNQNLDRIAFSNGFIESRMIGENQVIYRNLSNGLVVSEKLSEWDGITSGTDLTGSGVATAHFKSGSVTSNKLSSTSSLDGFSQANYVFNGSFEIDANTTSEPDLVGWSIYNEIASDPLYFGPAAGVFRTTLQAFAGFDSAVIQGADPSFIVGGGVRGVALYQDISFTDQVLNDRDMMASFYMKTDAAVPVNISGISGITASVQFLSSGVLIGSSQTIVNYTGAAIDWTKFETIDPFKYQGNDTANGIRISISGNTTNAINIYVDEFFVGITNLAAPWTKSQADIEYDQSLVKKNIVVTNLISVNSDFNSVSGSFNSAGSGVSTFGAISNPIGDIYTNSIFTLGGEIVDQTRSFAVFSGTGASTWTVPPDVTSILVEVWGAGGGGAAGTYGVPTFPLGAQGQGGGGGGGGQYSLSVIPVSSLQTLLLNVGSGGAAGSGIAPIINYYGKNGTSSTIRDSVGNILAQSAGGLGGGRGISGVSQTAPGSAPYYYTNSFSYINYYFTQIINATGTPLGGFGGGSTLYSNNLITISGNSGGYGQVVRFQPLQGAGVTTPNGGGDGGNPIPGLEFGDIITASGGAGFVATPTMPTHPADPIMNGLRGVQPGQGGGGGGGSGGNSPGGDGGPGADGMILIYY